MKYTLPNILTLSRLGLIPLIVLLDFFRLEGLKGSNASFIETWSTWAMLTAYTIAAITDYLDGYFARRERSQSVFGRVIDPIADKLLVISVLVLLLAKGPLEGVHMLPALLIMLREILVSGLREFLIEIRQTLPVTYLAKWKTLIQMLALGFLIAWEVGDHILPCHEIGLLMLWVAAILTLISGYSYLQRGIHYIRNKDQEAD